MLEKRSHVIAISVVLAILGATLPLIAVPMMSWSLALDKELKYLAFIGDRTLLRAEETFHAARVTLNRMQASDLEPCSPEHIALMRQHTLDSLYVAEIGYFADGMLKCTSWGTTRVEVPLAPPDYVTPDGLEVTLRLTPQVTRASEMTALASGSYNVLVLPSRFLDVFLPEGVSTALLNGEGRIIDTGNFPDPDQVLKAAARNTNGLDDDNLYTISHRRDLTLVTMESRDGLDAQFRRELLYLLPLGALMAGVLVGIVVWLSRKRLSPKAEMEIALRRREFIVHYQPIIALDTGACLGAEALVRWRQPDGTMVRPDLFIPLAEETGLVKPLTDQVVDLVLSDLDALLVNDRSLHIAVNVCADDLGTGRILDVIADRLRHSDVRADQIWIEATERGFIDVDAARATLERARATGHAIAIDDFGTGYSSLQYLHGLPVDALKIDKSFVDTIGRDSANRSVIDHIIAMARELGLMTIAEGVETADQAEYQRGNGVTCAQGWLYAKAMPPADFIAFCKASRQTRPRPGTPRPAAAQ